MTAQHDLRRIPPPQPLRQKPQAPGRQTNHTLRVLPLVFLIYSFLIFPIEVKLTIAGLHLYAFRLAIIAAIPFLIYFAPRRSGAFNKVDFLVFVSCGWIVVSFVDHYGIETGITRSLSIVLDTFGAYIVARGSVSSLNDLRRVLVLIIPGLLFAAGFFAIESVTRQLLIRPLYSSVFGSAVSYEGGVAQGNLVLLNEIRLGLRRAYSVFSFPILGGVILSSLLPLYLMSGLRPRAVFAGVVACSAAFFSLSSAAFIAIALGVGMVLFDRFLPRLKPLRWPLVVAGLTFYAILAEIALQGGIVGVVGRFTLNPATAYIRRMQWKYGGETVMDNPLFGIGYSIYNKPAWLTDAIDAHFLAMALRSGLLTPIAMVLAAVIVMFSLGRVAVFLPKIDRNFVVSLNIMLAVLLFISMTVTFFSEANVFFMIALGVTTSCMIAITQPRPAQMPRPRPMPPGAMPNSQGSPRSAPRTRESR